MYEYDFAADMAEQNALNKRRNKKKLNELLDKYGESKEAINQHSDLKDSMEYIFSQGDELIDEVLEERRQKRAQSSFPQTPYPSVARNNPEYVVLLPQETVVNSEFRNEIPHIGSRYYSALAQEESSGDYTKVLNDNKGVGAVGKYQFRAPAFRETGYMSIDNKFTGKDNIYSVEDFLNNPEIQEKAVRELTKRNYGYMKKYQAIPMLGAVVEGVKANFPITLSGILAASHKEGSGGTAKYLKSLEKTKNGRYHLPYDKYKGDILRSLLAVETRLRKFSDINED